MDLQLYAVSTLPNLLGSQIMDVPSLGTLRTLPYHLQATLFPLQLLTIRVLHRPSRKVLRLHLQDVLVRLV